MTGRISDGLARAAHASSLPGITVITRYKDLAGKSYESEWTLDPFAFKDSGIENSKSMNDLVGAEIEIPEAIAQRDGYRHKTESSSET